MDQIRVDGIEEAERVLDEMMKNYPKQSNTGNGVL